MRRTQWKLKEIEKEQDGTYALYYDTPDGSKKVRQHDSSFLRPSAERGRLCIVPPPSCFSSRVGDPPMFWLDASNS